MPKSGPLPELPDFDDGLEQSRGPTLVDWGLLVLRSVRRRPLLAAAVFFLAIDASVVYYRLKVPTYHVETKILAQRQQTLPSIVRPTVGDDVPTRLAWEIVHQRENLIALIEEAKLSPDAKGEQLNALVLRVDRALDVTTAEGTVTIAIDWPNPQQAYQLVEGALQNFLEARHLREITAIDEVISILQGRVETLRQDVEKATQQAQRDSARGVDGAARPLPRAQLSEDLVRLKSILDAKERAIRDVEDFRQRRLADLQAQLDAQSAVYSNAHPNIIALRQDIEALARESPQIASLREQERELRQAYLARLAREVRSESPTARPAVAGRAVRQGIDPSMLDREERVREARGQYDRMIERVNAAQLDLDAARAAFKFRYNVIWPAQMPKDPVSPNPFKVFGLGAIASLLLALFAAAAPDLLAGRIVERWQVERTLGVPVIAVLRRK